MPKGRIAERGLIERDHLETAQAILLTVSVDLDEVALRVQQSIRRTRLVADVLDPATRRIDEIRSELSQAHDELKQCWEVRHEEKWR